MKRTALVLLFLLSINLIISGQNKDSVATKPNLRFYGNAFHHHHDFFQKAFSFQGLELGTMINRNVILGVYTSFFASNLNSVVNNQPQYIWIGQAGINIGKLWFEQNWIHPGCQLNAGIFSLRTDDRNFGLFETNEAAFQLNGAVFSPQVFGEFNVTNWFRIRTGLSYNFYMYNDHSTISTADLQHLSFTFGMVFGRFK